MWVLSNQDFERIVAELEKLPARSDPSTRTKCWQTADELLSLFQSSNAPSSGKELDAALCERFLSDENCPIRPAYYPREDNCKRLWGHQTKVGPGPERNALRNKLTMQPRALEADGLVDAAPTFFVSHALEDHHFAARVRLALARHGVRCWLAEGELREACNLFESVEAALDRCDALIVLVSSLSISSAWVYSETTTALGINKPIAALIDASDTAMCELFRGWRSGGRNWLVSDDGVRASSAVLERYMRVGRASPTRIFKFHSEIDYTLHSLLFAGHVAYYPDVPPVWRDASVEKGFDAILEELATRNR